MPPLSLRPDWPSRCSMRAGAHFEPCCSTSALTQACGSMKSMKRFPPRPAACVTAAPAPKAGKILESGDGRALCAERSMIVTSMQLTISSRRDIAVLQKESSSLEGEEDVNRGRVIFERMNHIAICFRPHPLRVRELPRFHED